MAVAKNRRLEKEPDYNLKRRKGTNVHHLETCTACGFPIPDPLDVETGQSVPCSDGHVRCVRCKWPVAKEHISPAGTCVVCMSAYDRKRYYRRKGDARTSDDIRDVEERANFGAVVPAMDRDKERQRQQQPWKKKSQDTEQEKEMSVCHNGLHSPSSEDLDIGSLPNQPVQQPQSLNKNTTSPLDQDSLALPMSQE